MLGAGWGLGAGLRTIRLTLIVVALLITDRRAPAKTVKWLFRRVLIRQILYNGWAGLSGWSTTWVVSLCSRLLAFGDGNVECCMRNVMLKLRLLIYIGPVSCLGI